MYAVASLGRFRALAESRMTSRCTIRRRTGQRVPGANGIETDSWTVLYTDLPVRIGSLSMSAGTATKIAGRSLDGTEVNHSRHQASLPVTTSDIADGDLIEITDGENAGMVLRITEADWQDQATARRVPVEAVERPRGW
ncbi:MAG: DUF6093 family protein [Nocardioidaceae bacterium]|nr:DUF6093 family protein [Nocardioidaceae bacterium]